MSKFSVTATQLTRTAQQLSENNTQFRARVSDLEGCADQLAAMWEGEAHDKFYTAFMNDKDCWDEFAALIDQYRTALETVAQTYSNAEATNVDTATTRTY